MVFSKKNAGKWVASNGGKVIAADAKLSTVLHKIKGKSKKSLRLDLVPSTRFLTGFDAL